MPCHHPEVLGAPDWACLDCEPGWAEVHELALEEERLQKAKERALELIDVDAAWTYIGWQDEINDRILQTVRRLTSPTPRQPGRDNPDSGRPDISFRAR